MFYISIYTKTKKLISIFSYASKVRGVVPSRMSDVGHGTWLPQSDMSCVFHCAQIRSLTFDMFVILPNNACFLGSSVLLRRMSAWPGSWGRYESWYPPKSCDTKLGHLPPYHSFHHPLEKTCRSGGAPVCPRFDCPDRPRSHLACLGLPLCMKKKTFAVPVNIISTTDPRGETVRDQQQPPGHVACQPEQRQLQFPSNFEIIIIIISGLHQ